MDVGLAVAPAGTGAAEAVTEVVDIVGRALVCGGIRREVLWACVGNKILSEMALFSRM